MGEFELINHYFAAAPCAQGGEGVALGIGDDCALLALPPGEQLAVSTDTLVAGVHFAHKKQRNRKERKKKDKAKTK